MSSPQKRSAELEAAADAGHEAKRRHTEASHPALQAITGALHGEELATPLTSLLSGLVDSCLSKPQPKRDAFHDEVAGMLRDALSTVEAGMCQILGWQFR